MATFAETRTRMEAARGTDFTRLDEPTAHVYLDHAGAGQYPSRLLQRYFRHLSVELHANPHSGGSGSGWRTSEMVQATRERVLQHLNTSSEQYSVVFTSGCTAALKLLAESFKFSAEGSAAEAGSGGAFCFLNVNHTSVLGMREVAHERGACSVCFTEADLLKCFEQKRHDFAMHTSDNCLFALPAQSNFSGRRYPLDWVEKIHGLQSNSVRNFVLLDAAAYVSTSVLDLTKYRPDFVSLSFYKMFGFPTGLGALLVKNNKMKALRKTYFGGGTVKVSIPNERFHVFKDTLSDRFEEGTINYMGILALHHAFEAFHEITHGLMNVSDYTFTLTKVVYHYLKNCRHGNGTQIAVVYNDTEFEDSVCQGPIIAFNILRSNGAHMGFSEVSKLAQLYNVHLRTGCFCNPGDCQHHLDISNEHVKANFQEGHVCGDDMDLVNGLPTGAVRISLGYSNTVKDLVAFILFIEECFLEGRRRMNVVDIEEYVENKLRDMTDNNKQCITEHENINVPKAISNSVLERVNDSQPLITSNVRCQETPTAVISQICVYPVKSCGAFVTPSWKIGTHGLLYDREWMIVDSTGINLTQKKCPSLVHIQPLIDLDSGMLLLTFPGLDSISVPLTPSPDICLSLQMSCITPVCSDTVRGHVCDKQVSDWLEQALQMPGIRLVRQDQQQLRRSKRKPLIGRAASSSSISLANEAQYLLISEQSVKRFHKSMEEQAQSILADLADVPDVQNLMGRFRANIIIAGDMAPYQEETWGRVVLGHGHVFDVQGGCTRCQVICTDQATGEKERLVFRTLSAITNRKITFGILLNNSVVMDGRTISVGDVVSAADAI